MSPSRTVFVFTVLCVIVSNAVADETDPEYWKRVAEEELRHAVRVSRRNLNVAKNTIIFIGDGMGFPTLTAGRIMKGQIRGQSGEEYKLAIDQLPHTATAKVYSVDKQVPDSAATATALFCGVKTNDGVIGLNAKTTFGNCASSKGHEVQSILIDAFNAGKSTGIVTTTTVTHGTPAAAYAHTPNRDWYSDREVPPQAKEEGCIDIAAQFLGVSDKITVMMGGGRRHFKPIFTTDIENNATNDRLDGRDLVDEWLQKAVGLEKRKYVTNLAELLSVNTANTDRLLGLFEHDHMPLEFQRNPSIDPSLTQMANKALEILKKNPKGYLLIVEGGRIDHMHHMNAAGLGLLEMIAFDDAINATMKKVSNRDTLVIVTADHGHVMSHGGDMDRGSSILGLSPLSTLDNKPFTGITYGNGPGYHESVSNFMQLFNPFRSLSSERQDLTNVSTEGFYVFQTAVPTILETHSGTDVPIFASGPRSHLFHSVHEQHYVAHVVRYASGFDTSVSELRQKKENAARRQLSNLQTLCDHLFYPK